MVIKRYFDIGLTLFLGSMIFVMLYLVFGLFKPIDLTQVISVLSENDTFDSIMISFASIICSMFIVAVIGTLLAFKMSNRKGRIYKVCHSLILLPLLLPPTVSGLVLLQGFGRRSLLSQTFFEGQMQLAFSFGAVVVTQVFVTLPFFYQMTVNAFQSIDSCYVESAKVCGADSFSILRHILIPMCHNSIKAGIFLSALRGLSEFGATIMFAGNMAGKTQTMTTRIYQLYQGDMGAAFSLAGFQLLIFIIPFMLFVRKSHISDIES